MRAGRSFCAILRQEYQQGARARLRENAQICVLTLGNRSEGAEVPFTLLPSPAAILDTLSAICAFGIHPHFFFWAKNRLIRHTRHTFSNLASAGSPRQQDLLKIPGEKCAHGAATAAQKAAAAQAFAFSSPGSFELDKNQPKCARGGAAPLALALSLALTLSLSLTLTLSLTLVDKCPLYSPSAC